MSRALVLLACLAFVLTGAAPAAAYWRAAGTGTGTAATANMPTGATPTVVVTGRSVKVSWAQNAFAGGTVGSRGGGGYTVTRYAEGSSTPVAPGVGCSGTRTGATDPQTCTEANVPYGRWVYRVTPVLSTFTGTQGPLSAVAAVALAAPVLQTVTPQNPAAGATDGSIAVNWSASTDATDYNLFRRVSGGSYNFNAPLNGATPLTATSFSDTTATNSTSYNYVVRAVYAPTTTSSASSNELSAKVITRPPAPAGVTAGNGTGGVIALSWSAVAVAQGYNVYRRLATGTFNYTQPLNGATPLTAATFRDTTPAAGASYVYVIRSVITGAGAAQVDSVDSASTSPFSCSSSYNSTITAAGPADYFRLADTSAPSAVNASSTLRNGTYGGGVSFGQPGAIACDGNTAVGFDGTSGYLGAAASTVAVAGPNTFSVEVWFKTTSTQGGKLVGFGNSQAGTSSQYDRHLYLTNSGQVVFGVYPGTAKTVQSASAYNDGAWHMAVGTLGAAGLTLYVDGTQVGADPGTTAAETHDGYWRVGYDNLSGWPDNPTSSYFGGTLDEVAIFQSQLTATTVATQYAAGRP